MKKIAIFEEMIKNPEAFSGQTNIPYSLFWAYRNSMDKNCRVVAIDECIWERDIPMMVAFCKENNIKSFHIISGSSSMLETLMVFVENGCKVGAPKRIQYGVESKYCEEPQPVMRAAVEVRIV